VTPSRCSLTLGQEFTPLKNKFDSAIAGLDRLHLQGDDDGIWNGNGDERWAKLFEWVSEANYRLPLRSFSSSTLRLIRDTGNVLYNRINTEGYEEFQDDIQAVSAIADDIRDALLDYQVCNDRPYAAGVQLNRDTLIDGTATSDIRPELQVDCESNSLSTKGISDADRGF